MYIVDVRESEKGGPKAIISRTQPGLVKRLFETEVPEIYDGTVEIKAVSREAGSRTKLAVYSRDPNVDAVGACIGPRGARVGKVVDLLGGEKIDIVKYSENPAEFIAAALAPAESAQRRNRRRRGKFVPCNCAGYTAFPGHWQQRAERPPGSKADRLEDRYQAGERLL